MRHYTTRLRTVNVERALEVNKMRCNPLPLGMYSREESQSVNAILDRLRNNPAIMRAYTKGGECKDCRIFSRHDPLVNGAGYCLYHEWRRRELGLVR